MTKRIPVVALGLAILCWSGGVRAKVLAKSSFSGRITNTPAPTTVLLRFAQYSDGAAL